MLLGVAAARPSRTEQLSAAAGQPGAGLLLRRARAGAGAERFFIVRQAWYPPAEHRLVGVRCSAPLRCV